MYPVLLGDADLPAYYQLINYIDCRPADDDRIYSVASTIASELRSIKAR